MKNYYPDILVNTPLSFCDYCSGHHKISNTCVRRRGDHVSHITRILHTWTFIILTYSICAIVSSGVVRSYDAPSFSDLLSQPEIYGYMLLLYLSILVAQWLLIFVTDTLLYFAEITHETNCIVRRMCWTGLRVFSYGVILTINASSLTMIIIAYAQGGLVTVQLSWAVWSASFVTDILVYSPITIGLYYGIKRKCGVVNDYYRLGKRYPPWIPLWLKYYFTVVTCRGSSGSYSDDTPEMIL